MTVIVKEETSLALIKKIVCTFKLKQTKLQVSLSFGISSCIRNIAGTIFIPGFAMLFELC